MQDRIGNFEVIVLLAVMRVGEEAYGVEIAREIRRRLRGRSVSVASVYAALERLEIKGWVKRRLGDVTPVRGGKAKVYFNATAKGTQAARENRRTLQSFWSGIPALK